MATVGGSSKCTPKRSLANGSTRPCGSCARLDSAAARGFKPFVACAEPVALADSGGAAGSAAMTNAGAAAVADVDELSVSELGVVGRAGKRRIDSRTSGLGKRAASSSSTSSPLLWLHASNKLPGIVGVQIRLGVLREEAQHRELQLALGHASE